jgi:hypothetical protein
LVEFDETVSDHNCSPYSPTLGGKGITIWGPTDIYLAPSGQPNSSWTGTFTPTRPKCFNGIIYPNGITENRTCYCNIKYTIHTTQNSANTDVGPIIQTHSSTKIGYVYDEQTQQYRTTPESTNVSCSSDLWHSKIAGHDATLIHDISQNRDEDPNGHPVMFELPAAPKKIMWVFDDYGPNTITFTNNSDVEVQLQGLEIVRGYDMGNLMEDLADPSPCSQEVTPM